jgi:DNA polymerase
MNRLEVVEEVITCTACELHEQCSGPVPMRGEPSSVAIVGEAPGETEDLQGQPFIGPSGKLLQDLLDEFAFPPMGVLNTVSCWPHGTPTWEHVLACAPNKAAQIDYFDPQFLLLLGVVALKSMRPELSVRRGRARPFKHEGRVCFATYHPSAALRHPQYEDAMRADLEVFRELIDCGRDGWLKYIPATCSTCANDAVWWEEPAGLGWCEIHLPDKERGPYEARRHLLATEMEAARRRRAENQRDEGMAQVKEAADPTWMQDAWEALIEYLRTHPEFHVDDFWKDTELRMPREARALGPVVMKAARAGLMVKTGEFRESVRSNLSSKPCWRSLIYTPGVG